MLRGSNCKKDTPPRDKAGVWYGRFLFILFALFWGVIAQAQENKMTKQQILKQPATIPARVAAGKISLEQIPDPHWQVDGCLACHRKKPDKKGLHLRNENIDHTCNNCHSVLSDHSYIHPSDIKPSNKILKRMNKDFRKTIDRSKGKLSCITCHNLPKQCLPEHRKEKGLNPKFFRDGPYRKRIEICFQCHDKNAYKRLNPHDQIDAKGRIRKGRCGVCHKTLDGLTEALTIDDVDFNITDNLAKMCTGCHPWKPHPGGLSGPKRESLDKAKHLQIPPRDIKMYYDKQQKNGDVLLPLEPGTGKIFCGTCHNPHEKGIIKNPAAAKGADAKNRLRTGNICGQCHDI